MDEDKNTLDAMDALAFEEVLDDNSDDLNDILGLDELEDEAVDEYDDEYVDYAEEAEPTYLVECLTIPLKRKSIKVYYTFSKPIAKAFYYETGEIKRIKDADMWLLPEAKPIVNVDLFSKLVKMSTPQSETVEVTIKTVETVFEKDAFENKFLHNYLLKIQTEI